MTNEFVAKGLRTDCLLASSFRVQSSELHSAAATDAVVLSSEFFPAMYRSLPRVGWSVVIVYDG